jgi:hypothetical protein
MWTGFGVPDHKARPQATSDATLTLRRANVCRPSGSWSDDDYDVFDNDRNVGRVYLVDGYAPEDWLCLSLNSR